MNINDPRLAMLLARLGTDLADKLEAAYNHVPNSLGGARGLQDVADIRALVREMEALHNTKPAHRAAVAAALP